MTILILPPVLVKFRAEIKLRAETKWRIKLLWIKGGLIVIPEPDGVCGGGGGARVYKPLNYACKVR